MSAFAKVLECFPPHLALAVKNGVGEGYCFEIRVVRKKKITINCQKGLLVIDGVCSDIDMDHIVAKLCRNSLYAHEDTIKKGFIAFSDGVRVGVCGSAVVVDGKIRSVKDISSLNIRIPVKLPLICSPLINALEFYGFLKGGLVFSPPGVGKTTLLRHTAIALSSYPYLKRVALIDSRGELSVDCQSTLTLDVYKYYPTEDAIEMAIRTMSPQLIVCDEIGGLEEEKALLASSNKGVAILASAHGESIDGMMKNKCFANLHNAGLFGFYCRLSRGAGGMNFEFFDRSEVVI